MMNFKTFLVVILFLFLTSCSITQAPELLRNFTNKNSDDEYKIRIVVEDFGAQLQKVSLLSPDVNEGMQDYYSQFVTQDLLDKWLSSPQKAPGRQVSSPWPDRIEITNIQKVSSTMYSVDGEIIEVTSYEVVNGGAANKIPVHLAVENIKGEWLISDYELEDFHN